MDAQLTNIAHHICIQNFLLNRITFNRIIFNSITFFRINFQKICYLGLSTILEVVQSQLTVAVVTVYTKKNCSSLRANFAFNGALIPQSMLLPLTSIAELFHQRERCNVFITVKSLTKSWVGRFTSTHGWLTSRTNRNSFFVMFAK